MPDNLEKKVTRLAEIKLEVAKLKAESEQIEADFLKAAEADLQDTKLKTVVYCDKDGNRVTATNSDNVKLIYPSFLKNIFGAAYSDVVSEDIKYTLSAPAKRLLSALWKKDFSRDSLENIVSHLNCDDKAKKTLLKKLKGANFETDKRNLQNLAGLSEMEASDTAFMVAETIAWENFQRLLSLNNKEVDEAMIADALNYIDGAIVVEETPKITVEALYTPEEL